MDGPEDVMITIHLLLLFKAFRGQSIDIADQISNRFPIEHRVTGETATASEWPANAAANYW